MIWFSLVTRTILAAACLLALPLVSAAEDSDLSTPESAAHSYVDAINARDRARLNAMTAFPDTQFFRDGRTVTYLSADDYPKHSTYSAVLELTSTQILDQSRDRSLLKVVFLRRDDNSELRITAWWSFRLVDDAWKVSWRQVVHAERA